MHRPTGRFWANVTLWAVVVSALFFDRVPHAVSGGLALAGLVFAVVSYVVRQVHPSNEPACALAKGDSSATAAKGELAIDHVVNDDAPRSAVITAARSDDAASYFEASFVPSFDESIADVRILRMGSAKTEFMLTSFWNALEIQQSRSYVSDVVEIAKRLSKETTPCEVKLTRRGDIVVTPIIEEKLEHVVDPPAYREFISGR